MADFETEARITVDDDATSRLNRINKAFSNLNRSARSINGAGLFRGLGRAATNFGRVLQRSTRSAFRGIERGLVGAARGAGRILRGAASGLFSGLVTSIKVGIAAAVATPLAAIKLATDRLDAIGKRSRDTGFSVEGTQLLQRFADLNFRDPAALQQGLAAFNRRLGVLRQNLGDGKNTEFFKSFDEATQKQIAAADTTEKAFSVFLQALRRDVGTTDSAAIVNALDGALSEAGRKFLPLALASDADLQRNREDAQRFGFVANAEQVKNAEAFKDAITNIGEAFQGLSTNFATRVIPRITEFLGRFRDIISDNQSSLAEGAAQRFTQIFDSVSNFVERLSQGDFSSQIASTANAIGSFSSAMVTLSQVVVGIPQAFTSFVNSIEDFGTRLGRGARSTLGLSNRERQFTDSEIANSPNAAERRRRQSVNRVLADEQLEQEKLNLQIQANEFVSAAGQTRAAITEAGSSVSASLSATATGIDASGRSVVGAINALNQRLLSAGRVSNGGGITNTLPAGTDRPVLTGSGGGGF